jgi:hypothetical protein
MNGDIIQITDEAHPWFPALLIVDEATERRVLATCLMPMSNANGSRCAQASIRIRYDQFAICGQALIVAGGEKAGNEVTQ